MVYIYSSLKRLLPGIFFNKTFKMCFYFSKMIRFFYLFVAGFIDSGKQPKSAISV
jgi:hypothetical protein